MLFSVVLYWYSVWCVLLSVEDLWYIAVDCDARYIIFILILSQFPPWVLCDKICNGFGEVSGRSAFAVAPV